VVAEGHAVDARSDEFFVLLGGDARAVGDVLGVGDDQIGPVGVA